MDTNIRSYLVTIYNLKYLCIKQFGVELGHVINLFADGGATEADGGASAPL